MKKNLMMAVILILVAVVVYLFIRLTLPGGGISPPGWEGMSKPPLAAPQTREMDLFFADITGRRLSLERREVTGDTREDLLRRVVEELVKGPADEARMRTFPESTLVRAVYTREQTVWVDLGGAVQDEHPGGAWTEVLTVYSVVNTLTENFTDVSNVQILINGRESETFAGHVDISTPLTSRIQLLAGDWG